MFVRIVVVYGGMHAVLVLVLQPQKNRGENGRVRETVEVHLYDGSTAQGHAHDQRVGTRTHAVMPPPPSPNTLRAL